MFNSAELAEIRNTLVEFYSGLDQDIVVQQTRFTIHAQSAESQELWFISQGQLVHFGEVGPDSTVQELADNVIGTIRTMDEFRGHLDSMQPA